MGSDEKTPRPDADVDVEVLVIGAGVVGIYQLHLARAANFSVAALEAGDGVGGTWYWNRYPEARFDSESYSYGYLFSKELFDEWEWTEHFATQPEIESYLNHVVDRFDLRRHIRFGSKVVSAEYDEPSRTWTVRTADGYQVRARFVISATGGLSVPNLPDIAGLDDFRGESHHTGLWPHTPLDFAGKRVAVVGNGPSGAQILHAVADQVASVSMYQRTPTWCTPLNNGPITPEQQTWLRENFEQIRRTLTTSPSGFLHESSKRKAAADSKDERREFYEKIWKSPGFAKLTANYIDLTTDKAVNAEFCEFLANKIRSIVKDPVTAEKLIPKDHGFGGKRPPFVTGYYEAYNNPAVELVDLTETPIVRVTETGIETTDVLREHDIIVWATGFDFGTGALTRMGVRGRDGLNLDTDWAEGPSTTFGFSAHKLPNFLFPGGPHGAGGGNYPRYSADQVDFITATLVYMREHGYDVFEPPVAAEAEWMTMVETLAPLTPFSENHSHYYGANVAGKAKRYLLNPGGRPKLHHMIDAVVASDYAGYLSRSAGEDARSDAHSGTGPTCSGAVASPVIATATALLPFTDLDEAAPVTGTGPTGDPLLLATRCTSCRESWFPARPVCPICATRDPEGFPIGPGGTLYSFTTVHISSARATPYILGYVDTDQGVRVLSVIHGDADELELDARCSLVVGDDGQWWFSRKDSA